MFIARDAQNTPSLRRSDMRLKHIALLRSADFMSVLVAINIVLLRSTHVVSCAT
jgi:hypothetical protein